MAASILNQAGPEQDMLQNWWKNPATVIRALLQKDGIRLNR
jgi:hypothetical protein